MTMTDIEIFEPEGRAIPYAAEGKGPAVVLIAGQGLNVSYLAALAHSVATEDFEVVRIGSRRPASEAGASAPSMHDLARDVVDIMDHLGIDHAWVGGHGFGGSLAREVSHDHHDRVNGVVLLGVEGTSPAEPADVPAGVRDEAVADLQRAAREAASGEWTSLAPGIPVLVIQGTDDTVTPPENGEQLRRLSPDRVSVVGIEGAGHLFPLTHVGATSWAIEDYLDWD